MRVARVYTNRSCNQGCGFCDARSPHDERDFVAREAVERRLLDAMGDGPEELVLTGGEPTMRRDLDALIGLARERGADRVVLETNGALITPDRARGWAAAGLTLARIHLPAWGEDLDAMTRDPGGFDSTLRGAEALAEAGVALEVSAPVVRANAGSLPSLPVRLSEASLPFRALVLGVPTSAPDPSTLLDIASAAHVIETVEAAARRAGLDLRLDAHTFVPPCLFEHPARVAHLYSLTPGGAEREGYSRMDRCGACTVVARCPGFPDASVARGEAGPRPISEDRVRRRLSLISSVEEQVRRELYQDDVFRSDDGRTTPARIVRVGFRCNQACEFCFVSTHLPAAEDAAVEQAIEEIARQRGVLVLSGGEPTLSPRLVDWVGLGKTLGASFVELQTNAIRLRHGDYARRLAEAGVDLAFVSLHGSEAAISDAVTRAPGTFDATVLGVDEIVRAGISLRLNFVFCEENRHDFPAYVDMVATRWPAAAITVSFVAPSTDVVPRTRELIPRYTEVLPALSEGLRRAAAHGLQVDGFDSMCGIPLCLVPSSVARFFRLADVPPGFDRGEFVRSPACERCDLHGKCFGVRRGYAELHGTGEFRPVLRPADDGLA